MKILNIVLYTSLTLFSLILLGLFVKGNVGDPIGYQAKIDTRVGGPFESTNSTSRYVLTQSIVEQNSFTLTEKTARYAAPDLVYYNGKFLSIFTPGVSFLAVPFYKLGQLYGTPQLFTFSINLFAAVLNIFLVAAVARKFGVQRGIALLTGFIFLFGTNALAYSLTLTQHHLSVAVLLIIFLLVTSSLNIWKALLVGCLYGVGILLDVPNAFMGFPLLLYYFFRHVSLNTTEIKQILHLNLRIVLVFVGVIPFLLGFGFYNQQTTGSPTVIGQNLGRTNYFDTVEKKTDDARRLQEKKNSSAPSSSLPFKTRKQITGFYTLLVSNERSWLYYSPIVLIGVLGAIIAYRKRQTQNISILLISVVGLNVVLYAMFSDPWGGWSFGARYLIPGAAFLSAVLGVALSKYIKRSVFFALFLIVLIYSVFISVAGALTTSAIPPMVEAVSLSTKIPYTFDYNFQLLSQNQSSSLLYNLTLISKISAYEYFYLVSGLISLIFAVVASIYFFKFRKGTE